MIKAQPTSPILILNNTPEQKPVHFGIQTLWHPDTSGPTRGCAALCRWLCHKIFTPDPNFNHAMIKPNPNHTPKPIHNSPLALRAGASRLRCFAPSAFGAARLRRLSQVGFSTKYLPLNAIGQKSAILKTFL